MKFFVRVTPVLIPAFICQLLPAEEAKQVTKTYRTTPNLVSRLEQVNGGSEPSGPVDPFSAPATPPPKVNRTLREHFEQQGITFQDGAKVHYHIADETLTHSNHPHQIDLLESLLMSLRDRSEKQLLSYYEWIEVEQSDFSGWLFRNSIPSDGNDLRTEVQKWIADDDAEILQSATIITRSGQRGKSESVDEYIYPTEYHGPEVPDKVSSKDEANAPIQPAAPTAYSTRKLGTVLELDAVLDSSDGTYSVNLSAEDSHLVRLDTWHRHADDPAQQTHMPVFHSMRVNTQVSGSDGNYVFLGSASPRVAGNKDRESPLILHFIRCDVSALFDWEEIPAE